jgi:hypothetical protein
MTGFAGCCARDERPRERRTAHSTEKFSPPHARPQAQETALYRLDEYFDRAETGFEHRFAERAATYGDAKNPFEKMSLQSTSQRACGLS